MYHSRSTLRRAPLAALAVAAVTAGLITAGPAAFADPASSSSPTDQAGQDLGVVTLDGVGAGPKTITLITGDKVTLTSTASGAFSVEVDAAPRPDGHIPLFEGTGDEDASFLFPDDARPAVLSGVLDEDLFNLTYLAENGYTDAEVDSLPVIAQYPENQSMRALSASAGALPASEPRNELSSVHATALDVLKDDATDFWAAIAPTMAGFGLRPSALPTGISKLWLDHKTEISLDESVPMIGAPEAWDVGLDGSGVTVAVIDTGIDENHPDLAGKVIAAQSFTGISPSPHDGNGHGTHVASTIVGSGAASDGRYKGVAPGADLMIAKALLDTGSGFDSWVIDAMEWAANNGADVISMSLGKSPTTFDVLARSVDELSASTGALFVIAAGNDGPGEYTVASPGTAESALTVAAVDKSDQLADFSSRGPKIDGSMKPDIAAPGVAITAARSAGTDMGGHATPVDDYYITASGTSMATPHVAGAAAILAQAHPDWTPAELKAALMSTSVDDGYSAYEQGAGRVDVARAVDQTVFATTGNADFGIVPGNAEPATRQITYRNIGDADVTLTLTPSLNRVNGDSVADGVLTVDDQVRVPAGGTATATVTLTAAGVDEGAYTGAIVATNEATGTRLGTPVGFQRRPPMHTLTINVLDRDGQPGMPSSIQVLDVTNELGGFHKFGHWTSRGVFEVPVPEGTLTASAPFLWIDESRRTNFGYLLDPQIKVTGDTEITLDARNLKKYTFNTSRPAEVPASSNWLMMGWQRTLAHGSRAYSYVNAVNYYQFWATPTEPVEVGDLEAWAALPLAAPEVTLRVKGEPDLALHPATAPHEGNQFGNLTGEQFTGTQTLRLADAGLGRPEDLAGRDLTGKLALLEVNIGCYVHVDRLHNIRDAGAVGVLVWPSHEVNTTCVNGPSIPMSAALTVDDQDPNIGIPFVSIAPGEARALRDRLAQDTIRITVTGTPESSYLYEATPYEFGQIPDSVTYDLTDRHVARVDTEYHATAPAEFQQENWSFSANGAVALALFPPPVTGPTTNTHYVGPLSDQVLYSRQMFVNGADFNKVGVFDTPVRSRDVWNGTAAVSGSTTYPDAIANMNDPEAAQLQHFNFSACAMCREGDRFYPIFHRTFGGRTYSASYIAPSLTHLYQGAQEIPINTNKGTASFPMAADPGDYRLTLQDPGTRTDAEWTFHSRGTADTHEEANGLYCPSARSVASPTCRPEPLVYATYDLGSRLGLDNKVAAGGAHLFTINAYHAPSRADMPRIAGARLWYSLDDGDHWIPALTVPKGNGEFQALTIYPPYQFTSGAVSLKLQAWDRDGNTLTQTTTRAFELRPWHAHHTGPTAQ